MEATLSWLVPLLGHAQAHVELCPRRGRQDVTARLEALAAELRAAGATASTRIDFPDLLAANPSNSGAEHLVVLHGGGDLGLDLLRNSRASLFVTPTGLEPFAPRRILVPLDGSTKAEQILPLVERFTQAFAAEIVLLRVAPDETSEGALKARPNQVTTRLTLERSLLRASRRLEERGARVKVRIEDSGDLHDRILRAAHSSGADLIATSTHGHGRVARWLFGSCAERLLRRSQVPLLIRNARA